MSWIELSLHIPQDTLEQVSAYLFAHGCEGINVTEDRIIIYFNTYRWSNEIKLGIIEYLRMVIPGFSERNIRVKSVTDHDWTSDWKKYFRPLRATSRIVIIPPWEKYNPQTGEILIKINPKMAFGTGHHESTRLVIIEMEKVIQEGMHVLDIGTGSGILAILAEKLGAESVLGIDNDLTAIRNAHENAGLNKTGSSVNFAFAELHDLRESQYDLLLANINRNYLMQSAGDFGRYLKQKGILVLSGILRTDEQQIVREFVNKGFRLVRKNAMKDWLVLVMELVHKEDETNNN